MMIPTTFNQSIMGKVANGLFKYHENVPQKHCSVKISGGATRGGGWGGPGTPPLFRKLILGVRRKMENKLVSQEGCARSSLFVM